jgi:hypothetical protein
MVALGFEWLFGDALLALARGRGFRLGTALEPRHVQIHKRLEDAVPDLPRRKWNEYLRR